MAEDAWELLTRFHREVLKPEFESLTSSLEMTTKAELDLHFGEIHGRLDRHLAQVQEIGATLRRIEEAHQKMLEAEAEMKLKHASRR